MQVEKFAVQRPLRDRGEVVGGGEVVAHRKWLNGPGDFMQKYVHKNPRQDYTVSDFKEQYRVTRREVHADGEVGSLLKSGAVVFFNV